MATSMTAAQHPVSTVSLHPLASRDGQCSSTIVSVQIPQTQQDAPTASSLSNGYRHYSCDPHFLEEIQAKLDAQHEDDDSQQVSSFVVASGAATTPRLGPTDALNVGDLEAASYASLVDANDDAQEYGPESLEESDSHLVWGIQHDDLEQYPIIDDQPALCTCIEPDGLPQIFASDDAPPIRAMSAAQFADLHARYNALDTPHSVVFPFLHGVDGNNVAQNTFFRAPLAGQPAPNYRGLTVVRADLPTPAQQVQILKQQQQEQRRRKSTTSSMKFAMSVIESSTGHSLGGSHAVSLSAHCHESKDKPLSSSSSSSSSDEDSECHNDDAMSVRGDGVSNVNALALVPSASNASFSSSMSSSEQSRSHSFLSDLYDDDDDDDDGASHSESQTSFNTSLASDSIHCSAKGDRRRASISYNPQPDKCILNSSLYPYEIIVPPLMLNRKANKTFHVSPAAMAAALQQSDCVMLETASFFSPPQNPGVNLRNFKIQAAKYATISDIVIYCPTGIHEGAVTLAKWFREAQETWWENRLERKLGGLRYNVFVVTEPFQAFDAFPHLIAIDRAGVPRSRVDFVDREREEMQRLTAASCIDENVWLGCSADVPPSRGEEDCGLLSSLRINEDEDSTQLANPKAFSICIECHDAADIPDSVKLQQATHFLEAYDGLADPSVRQNGRQEDSGLIHSYVTNSAHSWESRLPSTPSGSKASVRVDSDDVSVPALATPTELVHLECSSVSGLSEETRFFKAASDIVNFCAWIKGQAQPSRRTTTTAITPTFSSSGSGHASSHGGILAGAFRSYGRHSSNPAYLAGNTSASGRGRSSSTNAGPAPSAKPAIPHRVLLHCGDGYTETSILALAYLMYARNLSLPEAYLDLQERAKRSFFVYARDVPFLKKLEQYIVANRSKAAPERPESPTDTSHRARSKHSFSWLGSEDRDQRRRNAAAGGGGATSVTRKESLTGSSNAETNASAEQSVWQRSIAGFVSAAGARKAIVSEKPTASTGPTTTPVDLMSPPSRALTPTPASVRAAQAAAASSAPAAVNEVTTTATAPSHAWFTHPRFEGAFPSRILPFLYLGNLNHALNPAMLRVLDITHVVSVGESALHPPLAAGAAVAESLGPDCGSKGQMTLPSLPEAEGLNSLWHEEQAGRILVLDLKNVSDDGIDPLRSTMQEAVEYIEAARRSGGKVLVHCRVGVSRSTTIVLAYAMAHLDMTLVESYLFVRSRRLSILIQPHLLFFWELRGWETFVATQKAKRKIAGLGKQHDVGEQNRTAPTLPPRRNNSTTTATAAAAILSSPISSPQQSDAFDLDVDIGQGAGSPYGFTVDDVARQTFGSGSPSGIQADALKLNWGFLCREIAALNDRYF